MKTEDINKLPILDYFKANSDRFRVDADDKWGPYRIAILNRFTQGWHRFMDINRESVKDKPGECEPFAYRDTCFYDTTGEGSYCFTARKLHKDGTIDTWSPSVALFPVGSMAKKHLKDLTPEFVEKWYAKVDDLFAKVDEYKKSKVKEWQAQWDKSRTEVLEQLEKAEKLVADAKKFFDTAEPLKDYKKLKFNHAYYVKEAVRNIEFMMEHT